ncbi:hypothetical protein GWI33_012876, partial [Rhynchophorus ferrugineus]
FYHVDVKEVRHQEESRRYQKKGNSNPDPGHKGPADHLNSYRVPGEYSEGEESLVSDDSAGSSDDERCNNVYVPPGVSPVPRRRPVRRKKSTGLSHKRSITYLVKPTVIRAPSTLRRPAKKTGKPMNKK